MIPSTIGAAFSFFLFVAPGLLFDLLAARRRAGVPETAFREASRVVLASTAFSAAAATVLGLLSLAIRPARERLMTWSSGGESLSATHPPVLAAMVAVAALACALAYGIHLLLARGGSPLRQTSAWSHVFRTEAPAGSAPYVRAKTSSGSTYTGFVGTYAPDLDAAGRELVLVPPLWSAPPGGSLKAVEHWSRIVLREDEIVVLMVDYRPDPTHLREGHVE